MTPMWLGSRKALCRALVLILAFSNLNSCRSLNTPAEESPYLGPGLSTRPIASNEIRVVDGWAILRRKVRDVLVTDGEALVSNSAPPVGKGPQDGEPYLMAVDLDGYALKWSSKYSPIAPIVVNSRNVFVVEQNRVIAADVNQGTKQWIVPFTGTDFTQAYADDALLVVATDRQLFAFNATDGSSQWIIDLPFSLDLSVPDPVNFGDFRDRSSLVKNGSSIYIRGVDSKESSTCAISLMALNANTGAAIWRASIIVPKAAEGCMSASFPLSFGAGLVVVANWSGNTAACTLDALDQKTGKIVWNTDLKDCSSGTRSIFLNGQMIVVSSADLVALNPRDGQLLWQREQPLGAYHQLVPGKGVIAALKDVTSENIFETMDIASGTISKYRFAVPTVCNSTTQILGGSDDRLVLENGDCLTAASAGQ